MGLMEKTSLLELEVDIPPHRVSKVGPMKLVSDIPSYYTPASYFFIHDIGIC